MTKQKVDISKSALPRFFFGGVALVLLLAMAVIPIVSGRKAYAYGQITSRGIKMSTSTANATANYTVTFTTATTAPIEGIVIDFCDNDPIINDNCQYTVGQSINVTAVAITSPVTGAVDTTQADWTTAGTDPGTTGGSTQGGFITLENATGGNTGNVTSGTTISFSLSGIVNPSYSTTTICAAVDQPNCTFYARMLTFAHATGANSAGSYTPTNIATNVPTDAGGAALSTAAQITLTSKVQEELTFCVYDVVATGGAAGCGTAYSTLSNEVPPAVFLGNNNDVLSTAGPFVDLNTQYQIQTNASNTANINIVGNTLEAGGFNIPGIITTPTTPALPATVSMFGLCNYETGNVGVNITITPNASYNGGAGHLCSTATQSSGLATVGGTTGGVTFFFDPTSTTALGTGYGDTIANATAGPTDIGVIAFMAEIGITQTAGIYTTSLGLIADASY